jgi:hypothetical protein
LESFISKTSLSNRDKRKDQTRRTIVIFLATKPGSKTTTFFVGVTAKLFVIWFDVALDAVDACFVVEEETSTQMIRIDDIDDVTFKKDQFLIVKYQYHPGFKISSISGKTECVPSHEAFGK